MSAPFRQETELERLFRQLLPPPCGGQVRKLSECGPTSFHSRSYSIKTRYVKLFPIATTHAQISVDSNYNPDFVPRDFLHTLRHIEPRKTLANFNLTYFHFLRIKFPLSQISVNIMLFKMCLPGAPPVFLLADF